MEQTATFTNNSSKRLVLNMASFFEKFDGYQTVNLEPGGEHTAGVECFVPQAMKRIKVFCDSQGVGLGSGGLLVAIENAVVE